MHAYCVHALRLSEEAAFKRMRAARTARRFPVIFTAIAEGRLNLNSVILLAPHLTDESAGELLAAATHKTRSEIENLLARRFPQPDLPLIVQPLVPPLDGRAAAIANKQLAARPVGTSEPPPKVTPLAPQRFALQVTVGQATHDKLRYAQALLGHQVPAGDVAQVLDRALDALIQKLERRARGHGHATHEPTPDDEPAPHPGARPAHGLGARRRPMHLRERSRPALHVTHAPRVRSRRRSGARGLRQLGFNAREARAAAALCSMSPRRRSRSGYAWH